VKGGQILSTSDEFTFQGSLQSTIAYLNTGCDLNGEKCTLLEMNINNPTCPGCGPSVDLSLITPHTFNVPTAFEFFGGTTNAFGTAGSCDGLGAICADAGCSTAFHDPNDTETQRACQLDNINLLVTFCGAGPSAFTSANPGSLSNIANQPIPNPPAQPKPVTTASTAVATTETHAPPPAIPSPATTSPVIVRPVAPIATAPMPTASSAGATSNSSNPPSRSGTKTCQNKRRRRASGNDLNLSLKRKRTGAGAHARAQDRARSLGGLAHF